MEHLFVKKGKVLSITQLNTLKSSYPIIGLIQEIRIEKSKLSVIILNI